MHKNLQVSQVTLNSFSYNKNRGKKQIFHILLRFYGDKFQNIPRGKKKQSESRNKNFNDVII